MEYIKRKKGRLALVFLAFFILFGAVVWSQNAEDGCQEKRLYRINTSVDGLPDNSIPLGLTADGQDLLLSWPSGSTWNGYRISRGWRGWHAYRAGTGGFGLLGTELIGDFWPGPIGSSEVQPGGSGQDQGTHGDGQGDNSGNNDQGDNNQGDTGGGPVYPPVEQKGSLNVQVKPNDKVTTSILAGECIGNSGHADASTNMAEVTISSDEQATSSGSPYCSHHRASSGANNTIEVGVNNQENAGAASGNAYALTEVGIMAEDMIHNNIVLNGDIGDLQEHSAANVYMNVLRNITTTILGNVQADTGDATASGNLSQTSIASEAQATSDTGEGCARGSSGANNTIEVGVYNEGDSTATSGDAWAVGVFAQDMINTNLVLNLAVGTLEEYSVSNMYIDVVYNIATSLYGSAKANTGDADASGNVSQTAIASDAEATSAVGQGCSHGSSGANNTIEVGVYNEGDSTASSGDAWAVGVLAQDMIGTNLVLNLAVDNLQERSASDMYIEVVYNIVTSLYGSAKADTGNATASGNVSQTTVASGAEATLGVGEGCSHGSSGANNEIDLGVYNKGDSAATSGDAWAVGVFAQDMINTNLVLNLVLGTLQEYSVSNMYIKVVYNIITSLYGSAEAATGDATASGNMSKTDISAEVRAIAFGSTDDHCSRGSGADNANATNVGNKGAFAASSGNALVVGMNGAKAQTLNDEINLRRNNSIGSAGAGANIDSAASQNEPIRDSAEKRSSMEEKGSTIGASGNTSASGNIAATNVSNNADAKVGQSNNSGVNTAATGNNMGSNQSGSPATSNTGSNGAEASTPPTRQQSSQVPIVQAYK